MKLESSVWNWKVRAVVGKKNWSWKVTDEVGNKSSTNFRISVSETFFELLSILSNLNGNVSTSDFPTLNFLTSRFPSYPFQLYVKWSSVTEPKTFFVKIDRNRFKFIIIHFCPQMDSRPRMVLNFQSMCFFHNDVEIDKKWFLDFVSVNDTRWWSQNVANRG